MNKAILGIAIAGAFVIGTLTANPVVEALGGWKEAIQEITSEQPIYEVSAVSVISAGTGTGSLVQLRCSEGDTFIDGERNTVLSLDPSKSFPVLRTDFIQVQENEPNIASTSGRVIGADVRASANGGQPTFDVPVTITGLCLNPNFLKDSSTPAPVPSPVIVKPLPSSVMSSASIVKHVPEVEIF